MRWLESIAQDVRYALRTMRASPGLAAVAILSLALGIGATAAILSVMYALVWRPLPVERPAQLVQVLGVYEGNLHTYAEWKLFRDRQDVFSSVLAYNHLDTALKITAAKQPQEVSGLYVSGNYFRTLGVPAALGRTLEPSDDQPGAPPVCVLGFRLWRRLYQQSGAVLGRPILVDGHEFQIVGVAPGSFSGVVIGHESELFLPLEAERTYQDYPPLYGRKTPSLDDRATILSMVGRLKPGESLSQANAGLQVLSAEIYRAQPKTDQSTTRAARRAPLMASFLAGSSDAWLEDMDVVLLLMGMAAVALIIACANLGNLLLARSVKRQGEMSIRFALGATRWRLVRQLLTETTALSLVGAAAGFLIKRWGGRALLWALSWPPDERLSLNLSWDTRLVVFAAGITLACALLFGMAPALRATGISIYSAMDNSAATARRQSRSLNSLLVILQVALSVALLASAGLLARTLHAFLTADLGYDPRGVLVAHASSQRPEESPQREALVGRELLTAFRAVPGVSSASWSRTFSKMTLPQLTVADPSAGSQRRLGAYLLFVSSNTFRTRRAPVLAGREFNDADTSASLPVAILSDALAKLLFTGVNPVGLRFRENDGSGQGPDTTVEVVGIAPDVQYRRPDLGPLPILYRPVSQCADSCSGIGDYAIRVAGSFNGMTERLESAAATVDPSVALKCNPMTQAINGVLHRNRAMELIAVTFSVFVGLLAVMGVYGVTSYAASQRTREIGIRMTLGAQPADVFRMVVGETMWVVLAGIVLGVIGGLAAAHSIQGLIWGVKPADPLSFGLAVCLMLLIAAMAAFLPARRASKADPITALRLE